MLVPRYLVSVVLLLVLSSPALAKRRVVQQPATLTPDVLSAVAARVADRQTWTYDPRLHWENAVLFDGLVLLGEQMNLRRPGSGDRLLNRAAAVLLESEDRIDTVHWGDGTAFAQAVLDLYRVLPPGDPRRERLLATLAGPMRFAEHALRATPATAPPRDPWWIGGGYGMRLWQDDLYMILPWLALNGSTHSGLPGNPLARELAHEWIDAYVPVLWDESAALFKHDPSSGAEFFWARGNGWALVALARAAHALDAPELHTYLRASAQSLLGRQSPAGGWGSYLSKPEECPEPETSGTALLTFFLARGVNEGWLEREVYEPVILRAMSVLMRRVDAHGNVSGIQPPDIGPNCGKTISNNGPINVNYGPGAILLATSEVMKLLSPHSGTAMYASEWHWYTVPNGTDSGR